MVLLLQAVYGLDRVIPIFLQLILLVHQLLQLQLYLLLHLHPVLLLLHRRLHGMLQLALIATIFDVLPHALRRTLIFLNL